MFADPTALAAITLTTAISDAALAQSVKARKRSRNDQPEKRSNATLARQTRAEREREAKMVGMTEPELQRYLKNLRQAAEARERQRARAKSAKAAGVT